MARRSKNQTQQQQPCYFCGGKNLATTRDHVPPRACFPDGFAPEGFDFPACKACNESSVKYDQVFGFYAMALDFDESNTSRPEDIAKLLKLKQGVLNNYAGALPDPTTAVPVYHEGAVHTLSPKAVSVETTDELKAAIQSIGQKLAHALYLKDTGKFLTPGHQYLASVYQPQVQGTDVLTDYFQHHAPQVDRGGTQEYQELRKPFQIYVGLHGRSGLLCLHGTVWQRAHFMGHHPWTFSRETKRWTVGGGNLAARREWRSARKRRRPLMATIEEYQNISIEDKLLRTAHHEAGHIVVAAQQGVPLRKDGISVDPVGEGLACYWKEPLGNDVSRKSVIRATFAGFDAEEEYCRLNSLPVLEGLPVIWSPDWTEARTLATRLDDIAPFTSANVVQESLHDESRLLIKQYWSAICAIAGALLAKEWEPLIELKSGGIWSHQATAKYLKAQELVPMLESFGIAATCRAS